MKPIRFSTSNANYVVVLEPKHEKPNLSWINEKFDLLVTELPIPPNEAFFSSPEFPDNRQKYMATGWYSPILKQLQQKRIPVVFADTPISFKEYDAMRKRYYLKKPVRNSSIAALLSGGLLGASAYWLNRKKHSKKRPAISSEKKGLSRRDFLQKGAVWGAGALGLAGATGLGISLSSSPVLGLEGRSAIIAERCEKDIAPHFSRGGQKPTVLIHVGSAHDDIVSFLKNPAARFQMLERVADSIKRIPPQLQRFQKQIFIFKFGPKAVEREVLQVPSVLERLKEQQTSSAVRARTRREFLAAAFLGRKTGRPKMPSNRRRR